MIMLECLDVKYFIGMDSTFLVFGSHVLSSSIYYQCGCRSIDSLVCQVQLSIRILRNLPNLLVVYSMILFYL